ncbi:MAG: translation initiation factor IF-3 [Flavobacteriales bacterium]|nr:translation initiation factor IF-3 [Flavobacteriales bacterium]
MQRESEHKINDRIRVPQVRVVGEGEEPKVFTTVAALSMAKEAGLDLVVISEKADPPIAKILDYKKFLYDQKKKQKEIKNKAQKVVVKEIRFGPNTDDHDYAFKKKHALKFLEDGFKIKAFVFFRGRSILFKDKGEILLLKLATEVEEIGIVEQMPKLEGKRMIMMLAPKKKK